MKKITQMKKDELISLALDKGLDVDESMTKEEIKNEISDAGITDDDLDNENDKVDRSAPAETEDEVLVRMLLDTKYYSFGRYVFTKEDPFAIMDKESAELIIKVNKNDFRKASEDEIRNFFK